MPEYIVSKAAVADLRAVTRYTVEYWNEEQARRYIASLRMCFQK
ncbi:type II toxin-antitoxin system RelE/ParE family toxin [Telmatobacter bradus]